MSQGASRLSPQHVNWIRDLPKRDQYQSQRQLSLHGALTEQSPSFLELGRSHTAARGFGVLLCMLFCVLFAASLPDVLAMDYYRLEEAWKGGLPAGPAVRVLQTDRVYFSATYFIGSFVLGLFLYGVLRFDTAPRDLPVRFNRSNGKVYLNGYRTTFLPFGQRGPTAKAWDWNTVHAEVARVSAFTGKVYQVRYTLVLSTCKPATGEVLDREYLAGPSMTDADFDPMWAYICRYMAEGGDGLPAQPVRDRGVYFWRSFFEYAEWIAPTRWGREARRLAPRGEKIAILVMSPLLVALLPLSLLMGLGHYLAMSAAPESAWPLELDRESRA
jgi:hypothetical protein